MNYKIIQQKLETLLGVEDVLIDVKPRGALAIKIIDDFGAEATDEELSMLEEEFAEIISDFFNKHSIQGNPKIYLTLENRTDSILSDMESDEDYILYASEEELKAPINYASLKVGARVDESSNPGEVRDEAVIMLTQARNALNECLDHLYDAQHLISRSLSENISKTLASKVINLIDKDSEEHVGIQEALNRILKTLNNADLTYNND
jgi:hypothetical protein